jgi:hypothetical protein
MNYERIHVEFVSNRKSFENQLVVFEAHHISLSP